MNSATEVHAGYQPVQETAVKTVVGSAILESIGAIATMALAIVGLAGVFSRPIAAIATIVFGAALWMEGGTFAATYGEARRTLEWGKGLTFDFLGGLTGVIFGILALLGVAPMALLSVGTLVFGATLLFSSVERYEIQSAFGLGAFVLGLLAVVGVNSLPLVLIALLCLGASALFSGATRGARTAIASH